MRKAIFFLTGLVLLNACNSSEKNPAVKAESTAVHDSPQNSKTATLPINSQKCKAGETLIYDDSGFSSYTEDKIRGSGVVSFQMDVNDRLDIYYPDDATFGFLVYNEDGTFYTINMPQKLIARWVVPAADFAKFDFDAEAVETNTDYLIVYANKKKLKVKKAGIKYTFSKWEDYIRSANIKLKECNLLDGAAQYRDMFFDVTEVNGDRIKLKSSKDCGGPDVKFKPLEGWLTWKKDGNLLVDFGICD